MKLVRLFCMLFLVIEIQSLCACSTMGMGYNPKREVEKIEEDNARRKEPIATTDSGGSAGGFLAGILGCLLEKGGGQALVSSTR